MKTLVINKNNRVILERTDTMYGMLVQGGVCGQKISVPVEVLAKVFGVEPAEIKTLDIEAPINDWGTTRESLIYEQWDYLYQNSRVIDKGVIVR